VSLASKFCHITISKYLKVKQMNAGADPGFILGGGVRGNRARSEEFWGTTESVQYLQFRTFQNAELKKKKVLRQF
jgi:hypothetical protein